MFEVILFVGLSWAVLTIARDCLRKERECEVGTPERSRWRTSRNIAAVGSIILLFLAWWSLIDLLLQGA